MTAHKRWFFLLVTMVLVVGATSLVGRSQAVNQPTSEPGRFTVVAQPIGDRKFGSFVIDSQTMHLMVYTFDFNRNQLKLVAVRDISEDVKLTQYNNAKPWPEDIRAMIEAGDKAPTTDAPK